MTPDKISILEMFSNASLMVQLVLLLLVGFSIASWTIILLKYNYIRKAFNESAYFVDFFWNSRDLSDAFAKAKQLDSSPVAKIFRIGYMELKKLNRSGVPIASSAGPGKNGGAFRGIDNVKRSLRRAINTEVTKLTQMVPFLATAGNTTPFIGLFGTVWGIMNSFHGIGQTGSASLAVVAPGIAEALIATAAGLAVAIPSVIAYNYFSQKIRVIESELISFSADFLNIVERDILRAGEG
ncbi:MAG: protein TolQ [Deltaproteobacteria bacterium]|nr:protein TolQ [Deltaproteobacteria bacterium]